MDAPPTFKRRSDGHARFAGNALMIAGLLVLVYALDLQGGIPGLVARLGALAAVVPHAFCGAAAAVDGVTLKRAVDAWVAADRRPAHA